MIYVLPNPMCLTDRFIFGTVDGMRCYVKVNRRNKIEEIGTDICKRLHGVSYDEIIGDKSCTVATRLEKSIFCRVDGEYWHSVANREKRFGANTNHHGVTGKREKLLRIIADAAVYVAEPMSTLRGKAILLSDFVEALASGTRFEGDAKEITDMMGFEEQEENS